MLSHTSLWRRLARPLLLASAGAVLLIPAAPAGAGSGGSGTSSGGGGDCVSGDKARLDRGKAIPPCSAPGRVVDVIRAANRIAKGYDYCYGGGHQSFKDNCYDCSGAVSYALHGGNFVKHPMPSGSYMRWGSKGRGTWITVYAHSGHVYAKIAGLRWDTSMTPGKGPGWSTEGRSSSGFKVRHKGKY